MLEVFKAIHQSFYMTIIAQKIKFSIKDLFSKCDQISTEKMLNGKFCFLCSVSKRVIAWHGSIQGELIQVVPQRLALGPFVFLFLLFVSFFFFAFVFCCCCCCFAVFWCFLTCAYTTYSTWLNLNIYCTDDTNLHACDTDIAFLVNMLQHDSHLAICYRVVWKKQNETNSRKISHSFWI